MGKKGPGNAAANARADKKHDRAIKNSLKKHKERAGNKDYQSTWVKFCLQVRAYNLRIRDVEADGNCLFRAVADQLEGNQSKHSHYRTLAVDYMHECTEMFQPFVDEEYGGYLRQMGKEGTWAGHLELLALAHACNIDVIIHQLGAPRLELRNSLATPDSPVLREIHVSYHDGQHYASVRSVEDYGNGPAMPFTLPSKPINLNDQSKNETGASKQEEIVMQLTGCKNLEYVKLVLQYNAYDTDATVEALVAEFNTSGGFGMDEDDKENKKAEIPANVEVKAEEPVAPPKKEDKSNTSQSKRAGAPAASSSSEPTLQELRRKNFNDLTNKERKLLRQLEKQEKTSKHEKRKEKARTRPRGDGNNGDSIPDEIGSISI